MMLLSVLVGCAQAPASPARPVIIEPPVYHPEKRKTPKPDVAVRRKEDDLGRKMEDLLRHLNAPLKPADDECF